MTELTPSERSYVLERLDRHHVADVAARVRTQLGSGQAVEACYMPGDGTHYALLFVPPRDVVGGKGGGSRGNPPTRWYTGTLLVVYAQGGTIVDLHEHIDLEYAASQLSPTPASALAIAELLRAVTDA